MCIFKKKLAIVPGQVDTVEGCDPSQDWLEGKMPTMLVRELIEHLDYRKSIHESYYCSIVEGSFPADSGYGDANFHLWAIEGYENAIFYLEQLRR